MQFRIGELPHELPSKVFSFSPNNLFPALETSRSKIPREFTASRFGPFRGGVGKTQQLLLSSAG